MTQASELRQHKLDDMGKGWFIGNFEPTLFRTEVVEVGVKHYKAGDSEERHYHKIATEFTVVVTGEIKMNNTLYKAGDILEVPPYTHTTFTAVTDAATTVVKIPGKRADKFYSNDDA